MGASLDPGLLALVAEHTHNGVVITDAAGLTLWVNPAFSRLTGFDTATMAGRKPGELLQGPDTDRTAVALMRSKLHAAEPIRALELVNYDRWRQRYRVLLDISPVQDAAGTLTHYIAIQTPLEDTVRAGAAALHEMLALERQDVFRRLRREVREPLNALLGFAQILRTQAESVALPGIAQRAEHIRGAGTRLLDLLDEMLSAAQGSDSRTSLQPVDLGESVLRHLPREVQVETGGRAAGGWIVWADPVLLRRALSLAGGLCAEAGQPAVATRVQIRGTPDGRRVDLHFAFEQAPDDANHGLRLGLLRRLMSELGGELSYRTAEDRAELFLSLRAAQRLASGPMASELGPSSGLWSTRLDVEGDVMYVEDDAGNIAVVEHALRSRPNVRLTVARDVDTAEALLQTRPAPQLLLLDLLLPGRGGKSLLEQLVQKPDFREMPVVVLTSIDDAAWETELRQLGAVDYLVKPVRLDRLLQLVDTHLAPPPQTTAAVAAAAH